MLRTLIAKDLRRATRNPVPWLISLVVPFFITGLIGMVFGPKDDGGAQLGTIHVALVDEDDTGVGEFLTSFLEQVRTSDSRRDVPFDLELTVLGREEAIRRTTWGEFSAVMILPDGFTEGYFDSATPVAIELIKNPAQGVHPRVVEEMLGLLVTALNGLRDIAGDELGDIRDLIRDDDDMLTKFALGASILVRTRERLEPVRDYLVPPLVSYTEETRAANPASASRDDNSKAGVFAFLTAGMAAMFILYLIDHAMRDLYRELRARTFERFRTVHEGLLPFIAGKILFAIAMGLIGALILLGGGSLIFQFSWREPLWLILLVAVYSFAGAGLLGVVAALAGSERRADTLGNILIMGSAMLGGCMFPPNMFPAFMREWIVPLMPPGWFASAARALQFEDATRVWMVPMVKLVVLGGVALALTTLLFRRRLAQGVRA